LALISTDSFIADVDKRVDWPFLGGRLGSAPGKVLDIENTNHTKYFTSWVSTVYYTFSSFLKEKIESPNRCMISCIVLGSVKLLGLIGDFGGERATKWDGVRVFWWWPKESYSLRAYIRSIISQRRFIDEILSRLRRDQLLYDY
jgi:hypothetical protein